jgi:hypothetical protein
MLPLQEMCYTLRDPISVGTFPTATESRPRGKAGRELINLQYFLHIFVQSGSKFFWLNTEPDPAIQTERDSVIKLRPDSPPTKKRDTGNVPNFFLNIN